MREEKWPIFAKALIGRNGGGLFLQRHPKADPGAPGGGLHLEPALLPVTELQPAPDIVQTLSVFPRPGGWKPRAVVRDRDLQGAVLHTRFQPDASPLGLPADPVLDRVLDQRLDRQGRNFHPAG